MAQLLRVPGTFNYKTEYKLPNGEPPSVALVTLKSLTVPTAIFDALPKVDNPESEWEEQPEQLDADDVIQKYGQRLDKRWHELYTTPPTSTEDWSKLLWRFLQSSFEAGMDKQEVWSVGIEAACNKFKRDGYKPNLQLWGDVLRAYAKYESLRSSLNKGSKPAIEIPTLFDEAEIDKYGATFVDRYFDWAKGRSDAPPQYHRLCAFVALSSLLAGNIIIRADATDYVPNLWAMILADTTMTRKSTAMDYATDLVESVPGCEDIVLATDGSMEGIFKAMSQRTGVPSLFKRDEIQGFMSSVGKKDYMAGTLEGLTKLYDGKSLKRQLTKESITVHSPVFLILSAGIKTKMFSVLTKDHVESGFLARFLFVTGSGSVATMKPLGPANERNKSAESELRSELSVLRGLYRDPKPYTVAGGQTAMASPAIEAHPTQAAFDRYHLFMTTIVQAGEDSIEPTTYSPMMLRFAESTLRCAGLLAAARQEPRNDRIVIEVSDVSKAISYTNEWIPSTVELLANLGRTAFEGDVIKTLAYVAANNGCHKGAVMRHFHFSARDMNNILDTLEGRGQLDIRRDAKASVLWAV